MNRIAVLSVCASLAFLLYIIEMVRRRKLREEYSILWLSGSIIVLVLSVKQDWLNRVSAAVGIAYPPSFLFLLGLLFIVLILIHFSMTISKLQHMNKKMAQELALVKIRVRIDERASASSAPATDAGGTPSIGNAATGGEDAGGGPMGSFRAPNGPCP